MRFSRRFIPTQLLIARDIRVLRRVYPDVPNAKLQDLIQSNKDLFESTAPDGASDPYWVRALTLYSELDDEQKTVLFEVIRQVMADTVSNFVGVLDGVSTLEGAQEDLKLMTESGSEKLNGGLQYLFLEMEEEA